VVGLGRRRKVGLLAAATDDLVRRASRRQLVGELAKIVGAGEAAGPPWPAGGKDPAKLGEALEHAAP